MSKFWKVVVIVLIVMLAMVAITYLVPQVKEFAKGLAVSTKLPLWIVGLLAPILFLFKKLGDGLKGLLGSGATEEEIAQKNKAIETKLSQLEQDVQNLDVWRKSEIEARNKKIDEFNRNIDSMEGRAKTLDETISGLTQRREQLQSAMRVDPDID